MRKELYVEVVLLLAVVAAAAVAALASNPAAQSAATAMVAVVFILRTVRALLLLVFVAARSWAGSLRRACAVLPRVLVGVKEGPIRRAAGARARGHCATVRSR